MVSSSAPKVTGMAKRKLTDNEIKQVLIISGFCDHMKTALDINNLSIEELKIAGQDRLLNYIGHLESAMSRAERDDNFKEVSKLKFYVTALNTVRENEADHQAFINNLVATLK
jgi:hypothetical protein